MGSSTSTSTRTRGDGLEYEYEYENEGGEHEYEERAGCGQRRRLFARGVGSDPRAVRALGVDRGRLARLVWVGRDG
jgi:hypothetical protein